MVSPFAKPKVLPPLKEVLVACMRRGFLTLQSAAETLIFFHNEGPSGSGKRVSRNPERDSSCNDAMDVISL